MSVSVPVAGARASVDYGPEVPALGGSATGIEATLTRGSLNTGSHADGNIYPSGWTKSDDGRYVNGQDANLSRGHLLAKMLGGDGGDPRNLVTLYQHPTNSPVMRDLEQSIYDAVAAGQTVNYSVIPIFDRSGLPSALVISARGSDGFSLDVTLRNLNGRTTDE